ncbi:hypothetical protein [Streptomyces sp. TP-A0874]|uniref:hypothetical protein n=1 Tax=Streptomyces sp. TP-A0874 TaxID=549819 RepID=UPI00278C4A0F|nr:hypothetical protein [Streptomyces sp. TP-A0874]
MNSTEHLLPEDRPEFERILEEALEKAGRQPDVERLRAMALEASAAIASRASAEYRRYVRLREEHTAGAIAGSGAAEAAEGSSPPQPRSVADGTADAAGSGTGERTGAGLLAVVAVLAPPLAAAAATVFLLVGYLLRILSPGQALADSLILAGWVFTALTAAGIIVAIVALLTTALRGDRQPRKAGGGTVSAETEELALARAAWEQALLERGLLPFLEQARSPGGAGPELPPAPAQGGAEPHGRTPHLGYSRPGFSSPKRADSANRGSSSRPRFDSPGYSSPDYGGPDHAPE